ncbi:MAG: hypothetical protein M1821_008567 [Bathelium mastoideum]|nr:MAG: hypothetical protein M1821_008567 [Bathelium mastoideum]
MAPESDPIELISPLQKRPTRASYDSQDDSGDDFFDHETIATIPLHQQKTPSRDREAEMSSPMPYISQPTQPLPNSNATELAKNTTKTVSPAPTVQVPASSPVALTPITHRPQPPITGINFAPPGTTFRRPALPPQTMQIPPGDGSSPIHQSLLSDEEELDLDIKPTIFSNGNRNAQSPPRSFGMNLSKFNYTGQEAKDNSSSQNTQAPLKRPADDSASAYGSVRRPAKQMRQTGPAKAQPVVLDGENISLEDIGDFEVKKSIQKMQQVVTHASVAQCWAALRKAKSNFNDAMDILFDGSLDRETVDLTASDDELQLPQTTLPEPVAKRQVKDQGQSIQSKWSSTQAQKRPVQKDSSSKPAPAPVPKASSPPPPQRKRLLSRKRQPSSSPVPVDDDDEGIKITKSSQQTPIAKNASHQDRVRNPQNITVIDSDSDSGLGHDRDEDIEDGSEKAEKELLKFLNECSIEALADLSNQTEESASLVVQERPFRSLGQVRAVSEYKAKTTKSRRPRKPIGDRIVDVCLDMWIGFEAVDKLVKRCEALGKNLQAAMRPLGLVTEGALQAGELSSIRLEDTPTTENGFNHDSGIGTPSSSAPIPDDDSENATRKNKAQRKSDLLESDPDFEAKKKAQKSHKSGLSQPAMMSKDLIMKDYQLAGLTWLSVLFEQKMSGILADDMGLGKTCQVIAFLSHLTETGVRGPHLIFVPGSTLENWLRELRKFSPDLYVEPYYGTQGERASQRALIEDNLEFVNVVVTTYDMAKGKSMLDGNIDARFLRKLRPVVTVYDEGHVLRNRNNKLYETLIRIPSQFRLLLTGTPLQNNLQELISLLAFIMPDVFREHEEDLQNIFKYKAKTVDSNHAGLLSVRRINRARSMMTPFVLRRKKHQVLDLPHKTRKVELCELLPGTHRDAYMSHLAEERPELEQSTTAKKGTKRGAGALAGLRSAAIHPLLFRRLYDDDKLRKIIRIAKQHDLVDGPDNLVWPAYAKMGDFDLHKYCWENSEVLGDFKLQHDEWMDSGKVQKLCELLARFKANGDRTLIFSQFTKVMDILERVLADLGLAFHRLDGDTAISDRLTMVDEFYQDSSIPVFMLSTKAGGTGINLAAANKVIIFDSSFNPQDDIQAENRAHRVGQTREVEVIRLITKGTIEEQIYALGESKIAMDERVAGEGAVEGDEGTANAAGEEQVRQMMIESLKKKDKAGDVKEEFLNGLKDAGLDMSAA